MIYGKKDVWRILNPIGGTESVLAKSSSIFTDDQWRTIADDVPDMFKHLVPSHILNKQPVTPVADNLSTVDTDFYPDPSTFVDLIDPDSQEGEW
jgi:hypothetical protein